MRPDSQRPRGVSDGYSIEDKPGVSISHGRALESRVLRIEIVGRIAQQETVATGRQIREFARLQKVYGPGRWRKRKGMAKVKLPDGTIARAEVHWYEAHGVGRKEFKVKRILE